MIESGGRVYDQHYRALRQRIGGLLSGMDETELQRMVPACPEWTLLDVLRHLSGVAADVQADNLGQIGTPGWTDTHVRTRQGFGVRELLAEWEVNAPAVEELIRRDRVKRPFIDALTHEADLRSALGLGGLPAEPVWDALHLLTRFKDRSGAPGTLVLDIDGQRLERGAGEPVTTLEVTSFELFRGIMGRRSKTQIESWAWRPSPGAWAESLPVFPASEVDLVESA